MGLQEVFKSVFPIKDFNETASLEFVSYSLGEPKYDVEECHQRGMTYRRAVKSDRAVGAVGRRSTDRRRAASKTSKNRKFILVKFRS